MRGQKTPALRQRHRMRKNTLDFCDLHAGERDQIMPDAQQRLPLDAQIVRQQQVEVLRDRAGQAVLDGNHRRLHRALRSQPQRRRRKRKGHDSPSGTSFIAASWLNEPNSP